VISSIPKEPDTKAARRDVRSPGWFSQLPIPVPASGPPCVDGEIELVRSGQTALETLQGRAWEQQIAETSRLVSIGELAAGVAHEINNPIAIVAGFAELMMECALEPPLEDYVQRIYVESQRAARIAQNLLVYSKKHEPIKRYASLKTILLRALELKKYEFTVRNIQVKTHWPSNLPRTMVDEHGLTQAILNILTNAEQALSVSYRGGNVELAARVCGGKLKIRISDNGPGIPEDNLRRVFDPYFTSKDIGDGTGLGLSDSRCIVVQNHGGRIWVESKLGEGSAFFIELPILRPEADTGSGTC